MISAKPTELQPDPRVDDRSHQQRGFGWLGCRTSRHRPPGNPFGSGAAPCSGSGRARPVSTIKPRHLDRALLNMKPGEGEEVGEAEGEVSAADEFLAGQSGGVITATGLLSMAKASHAWASPRRTGRSPICIQRFSKTSKKTFDARSTRKQSGSLHRIHQRHARHDDAGMGSLPSDERPNTPAAEARRSSNCRTSSTANPTHRSDGMDLEVLVDAERTLGVDRPTLLILGRPTATTVRPSTPDWQPGRLLADHRSDAQSTGAGRRGLPSAESVDQARRFCSVQRPLPRRGNRGRVDGGDLERLQRALNRLEG